MPDGVNAADRVRDEARDCPTEDMDVASSEYEFGPGTPESNVGGNFGVLEPNEPLYPLLDTLGDSINNADWYSGITL